MSEEFASLPLSNTTVLCVGGITRDEAEAARSEGAPVDGQGYYLFVADEAEPSQPIQILAKLFSAVEADQLARLFSRSRRIALA